MQEIVSSFNINLINYILLRGKLLYGFWPIPVRILYSTLDCDADLNRQSLDPGQNQYCWGYYIGSILGTAYCFAGGCLSRYRST